MSLFTKLKFPNIDISDRAMMESLPVEIMAPWLVDVNRHCNEVSPNRPTRGTTLDMVVMWAESLKPMGALHPILNSEQKLGIENVRLFTRMLNDRIIAFED